MLQLSCQENYTQGSLILALVMQNMHTAAYAKQSVSET